MSLPWHDMILSTSNIFVDPCHGQLGVENQEHYWVASVAASYFGTLPTCEDLHLDYRLMCLDLLGQSWFLIRISDMGFPRNDWNWPWIQGPLLQTLWCRDVNIRWMSPKVSWGDTRPSTVISRLWMGTGKTTTASWSFTSFNRWGSPHADAIQA